MTYSKESFNPIKNYRGLYMVSNHGRILSVRRKKILKPAINTSGYLKMNFSKYGVTKNHLVHTLVWNNFIGEDRHGLVLDHIDDNKKNNRLENLRLISHRENVSKGYRKKQTTSEFVGVFWNKQKQKWNAKIWINGKFKHLGFFDNEIDAGLAYRRALGVIDNG